MTRAVIAGRDSTGVVAINTNLMIFCTVPVITAHKTSAVGASVRHCLMNHIHGHKSHDLRIFIIHIGTFLI